MLERSGKFWSFFPLLLQLFRCYCFYGSCSLVWRSFAIFRVPVPYFAPSFQEFRYFWGSISLFRAKRAEVLLSLGFWWRQTFRSFSIFGVPFPYFAPNLQKFCYLWGSGGAKLSEVFLFLGLQFLIWRQTFRSFAIFGAPVPYLAPDFQKFCYFWGSSSLFCAKHSEVSQFLGLHFLILRQTCRSFATFEAMVPHLAPNFQKFCYFLGSSSLFCAKLSEVSQFFGLQFLIWR